MNIVVQNDVYVIILITLILSVLIIVLSKFVAKANPLEKPKGIVVPVIWLVEMVNRNVENNVGKKNALKLTPYILVLWLYIFFSNIIGLFGLNSPTSNLSVTLLLAFLTWLIIQFVEFKYDGVKAWFHAFLEPLPVMLPMNIIGKFSTMISMSLRLFGNILCGGIMMQLVYNSTQALANTIGQALGAQGSIFNFIAPFIAPILHVYFDLFAGFIQTLVFVTLTMVLIGNDIPEEAKKA